MVKNVWFLQKKQHRLFQIAQHKPQRERSAKIKRHKMIYPAKIRSFLIQNITRIQCDKVKYYFWKSKKLFKNLRDRKGWRNLNSSIRQIMPLRMKSKIVNTICIRNQFWNNQMIQWIPSKDFSNCSHINQVKCILLKTQITINTSRVRKRITALELVE